MDTQLDLLTPVFFVHYTTEVRSWLCVGLCASFATSLIQDKYEVATLLGMKCVPVPNPQEAGREELTWVDIDFDPFEFILKIHFGQEDKRSVINITSDSQVQLFSFTHCISFPLQEEPKKGVWKFEKLSKDMEIEVFAQVVS